MPYTYDGDAIEKDGDLLWDDIGQRESSIIIDLLEGKDYDAAKIARLKAVNADLAAACKSALQWLEFTHMADPGKVGSIYANELRAAIAKAEGQQPA